MPRACGGLDGLLRESALLHGGEEVVVFGGALFFTSDIGFKGVLHIVGEIAS